jgi:hypothetical protein
MAVLSYDNAITLLNDVAWTRIAAGHVEFAFSCANLRAEGHSCEHAATE